MADQMNAPSMTSSSKEEQFVKDLVQFYRNKGIQSADPAQFVARLNGKSVLLSELYSLVLEAGGSYKVNQLNLWEQTYFKLFKCNQIGANFAVALRQVYNRYLLQYEKGSSGNQNTEQWNEDEDEENLFRTATLNANSQNYYPHGYQLHQMHQQQHQKKFTEDVTELSGLVHNNTKLYCSLLSGLPNELNFAYNIATILSNSSRFDWSNDYKFVNVLLESIKSYCCICDQFTEDRSLNRKTTTEEDEVKAFSEFIKSSIKSITKRNNDKRLPAQMNGNCNGIEEGGDGNEEENDFELLNHELPKKDKIRLLEQNCQCYREFWYQICSDEEMLNLVFDDNEDIDIDDSKINFPLHLLNKIEQRIELVAEIIRNTSFTYDQNKPHGVTLEGLIRFLTLLIRSDNVRYLNISLDILANIAPALKLVSRSKPKSSTYKQLLNIIINQIVDISLNSTNLHETTKSFEILSRYISEPNSDVYSFLEIHFQDNQLYNRITQLMTCQYEVTLLLALLEFCLTVSETRPGFLTNSDSKTLIKLLLTFLNSEASQHFTTGALKRVKMYDDRPRTEVPQPETTAKNIVISINRPASTQIIQQLQPPPKLNQVQPNIVENELYANNWLRSNYDEVQGSGQIKIQDIYAEYVKFCCRNSRKNVIAAQSFNVLLRKCFPSCAININNTIVEGIMPRAQLQTIAVNANPIPGQPNQLMSPILKAHLSTPSKANSTPPGTPNVNESTSTQPITATTSTLIKSLLANKLRNNQQIMAGPNSPVAKVTIPSTSQVSSQVVIQHSQNDATHKIEPQNNIVLTPNSTGTMNIAQNLPNNFIMSPSSTTGQHQPGLAPQQQLMLVRTFITVPGQNNQAVRLLVPASMIQQRLPAPAINGLMGSALSNNGSQVVPASQQVPVAVPSVTSNAVATTCEPLTNFLQTPPVRPQANASPLLNVLLDKGKLPEQSINVTESNQPGAPASKPILILATPKTANSISENYSTGITSTISNNVDAKLTTVPQLNKLALSLPLVNGDVKPDDLPNLNNKHSLENCDSNDSNKKFKVEMSSNENINKIVSGASTDKTVMNGNKEDQDGSNPSLSNNEDRVLDYRENKPALSNPAPNVPEVASSIPVVPAVTQLVVPVVQPDPQPLPTPKPELPLDFECHWGNCIMKFSKPSEVFYHVHTQHIMVDSCPAIMNCIWGSAEGKGPGCLAKRPKLSLLTHLEDFHCNTNILKQEMIRKKQLALTGATNIQLPQPPAHPGYAQNAAMLAIRRISSSIEPVVAESTNQLTPLTVSIRLTSALILRNLAQRSHSVKKTLEMYEPLLCELSTIDGRDESRTIAQMLAIMNENSSKK